MELTKKEKCFIFDIILNQEEEFTVLSIREHILCNYGLSVPLDDIQSVLDGMEADGAFEPERCDKTVDMFEVAA